MNYTDNPVTDIDTFIMQRDRQQEIEANEFCERVNNEMMSLDTFKSFLHDIDYDDPAVQAIHGCMEEDLMTKAYAYDQLIIMFEDYCAMLVDL